VVANVSGESAPFITMKMVFVHQWPKYASEMSTDSHLGGLCSVPELYVWDV
jgi:hypothetical protein